MDEEARKLRRISNNNNNNDFFCANILEGQAQNQWIKQTRNRKTMRELSMGG